MTNLTAIEIASMTRTQVWAHITDNALPVAKKRSTDDARQALIEYVNSLEVTDAEMEQVAHKADVANQLEVTDAEMEQVAYQADVAQVVKEVIEWSEKAEAAQNQAVEKGYGALTPVLLLVTALTVILTELLIPASILAVNLIYKGFGKAQATYKRLAANRNQSQSVQYFQEVG
jgi:hypothetical protein